MYFNVYLVFLFCLYADYRSSFVEIFGMKLWQVLGAELQIIVVDAEVLTYNCMLGFCKLLNGNLL